MDFNAKSSQPAEAYKAFGLPVLEDVKPSRLEKIAKTAKKVGGVATKVLLLPLAVYFITGRIIPKLLF